MPPAGGTDVCYRPPRYFAYGYGRWHGEDDLRNRAQRLRGELGLDALLVTRSEEGMTLFDAAGDFTVKAQAREVFDVTGAGDTVIATYTAALAAGADAEDAARLANYAGGIVVMKRGTATVSQAELLRAVTEA